MRGWQPPTHSKPRSLRAARFGSQPWRACPLPRQKPIPWPGLAGHGGQQVWVQGRAPRPQGLRADSPGRPGAPGGRSQVGPGGSVLRTPFALVLPMRPRIGLAGRNGARALCSHHEPAIGRGSFSPRRLGASPTPRAENYSLPFPIVGLFPNAGPGPGPRLRGATADPRGQREPLRGAVHGGRGGCRAVRSSWLVGPLQLRATPKGARPAHRSRAETQPGG